MLEYFAVFRDAATCAAAHVSPEDAAREHSAVVHRHTDSFTRFNGGDDASV